MTREIGFQTNGLWGWGDIEADVAESNPELQWPHSIEVYDKMRREEAQIASVLRAVMLPIRSANWHIEPGAARPEVVEFVSRDLGIPVRGQSISRPLRSRGRFSWAEHVRLALLELVFGHAFFEQVYEARDDGLAHLSKLAYRPPRTISKLNVARDGGLLSIEQQAGDRSARIPINRLVVYVNEREGSNWLGTSLLRAAYKNWLLKDRLLRAQSLTVERNGLGVPVYTGAEPPKNAQLEELRQWNAKEQESGLLVATSFRAGSDAGAAIPHSASLDLKGVSGSIPDTEGPIRYHDEQIARSVLAHFLNLGTETGSWALGSTFADFFAQSLNAVAGQIQDIANQHVVEDLVDLNWGKTEPAPILGVDEIGKEHPVTAEAIRALVESGVLVADDMLETHVRGLYGLPLVDKESARGCAGEEGGVG